MRKTLLICLFLLSSNIFADGQLTTIQPGISLYSEYYPNPNATFKGTIIFENGSGTDMGEWGSNQVFFQCVKNIGSVFFYDRSGLGKSPPDYMLSANSPLTAKLVSDRLYLLLNKLRIKPPYLVVAHSYGAMYAGYFILKHPNLIKGVIFVDPVPRDFDFSNQIINQYSAGVKDAKKMSAAAIYKKYPNSDAEVFYQLLGFNQSKQSIRTLGSIYNNIPIIIISSTAMEQEKPITEDWYTSQQQWLNQNPLSKIMQVSSGHFIQLEQPQKVCEAINEVANQ